MRGDSTDPEPVFSHITTAQRVPQDHPLRPVRAMADEALRALLLQYFYGIRSERLLMEQLEYNLLFRWFVGLSMSGARKGPTFRPTCPLPFRCF